MSRLASGLAVLLSAATVAGCGGGGEAAGPLDEALGYLPSDAPFAVSIETDVHGEQYRSLDRLAGRFPFGGQAESALKDLLEEDGDVDFERDVRPVLGNPFVVGAPDARSLTGGTDDSGYVAAIQAADKAALDKLLARSKPKETGERGGAKLYRDEDGDPYAVKDDVLIVAGSKRLLESALDSREQDDRLREEDFDQALEGLPGEALVRLYADLGALIASDPDSRGARKVPWVNGLRTLGLTASAESDGLAIEYLANTEDVADEDLPIAPGDESPGVVRRAGDVAVGIRDLRRIVEFGEAASQAVDPSGFGDYQAAKEQIDQLFGVSIDNDVIAQLTGDTAVNVAADGSVAVRAELKDPAAFERTLRKLADVLPQAAEGFGVGEYSLAKPSGEQGLYRLGDSDGQNWFFGVVNEVFVLDESAAGARRLAAASPAQVADARGSVVSVTDAEKSANVLLDSFGAHLGVEGAAGRLFTGPLGDLVSSTSATTEGLRGSLRLEIE